MTPKSPLSRFRLLIVLGLFALVALTIYGAFSTQLSSAAPAGALAPQVPLDGTEALPPGTTITTILPNLTNGPVSMAFDPAGRLFFTEKGQTANVGQVRLYASGALQAAPVITFPADGTCSERGLLGIALDPNFTSNHYIYVYYTFYTGAACASTDNRVVRFVENNGVGSNPQIIFSSPQTAGNHNGGNIHFGPDGKLYISIGDNANAANAQNVTVKNGKIHRINADGTIPSGNPVFTQTGALGSLYAMGVRNSFDFVMDPFTPPAPFPRIFASENGPSCDDEMNRIEAGYNYGWRANYPCDDPAPSSTYNTIPPLWYLPTGLCCDAPTGITIYTGAQIPQWTGELFMAAFNGSKLRHFYLNPQRTLVTQTNVVQGISIAGDIETGPDGALWFFQESPYSPQVNLRRLSGPGATSTPQPTATNTSVPPSPTNMPIQSSPTNTILQPSPTRTNTPGSATNTPTEQPTFTNTPVPPTSTVFPTPTACSVSFSDVPVGSTFYEFITCMACQGILGGYADGTFRPGNNVTRGQIAKIVSNAAGFDLTFEPDRQTFEDVAPGTTFYEFVERLAFYNIMSGYICGGPGEPCGVGNKPYFRPNANASRGQIAKIVANAAGFNDTLATGTQTFEDVPEGSTFYVFIERLLLNRPGVMNGYPCGGTGEPCGVGNKPYFRTAANASRGQTAKIVSNTFYPGCVVPVRVKIEQFAFHPPDLTIKVGTVVRFVNRDLDYHTATEVSNAFDTDRLYQNQFKDITFNTVGNYEYFCEPHPFMRGYIHVIP